MPRPPTKGAYPANWGERAKAVKVAALWRCERCGAAHNPDPRTGQCLTVDHLDGDKANCVTWNLAALCQRCHLHRQGRVNMFQDWMFEHTEWMRPHVEGRDAAMAAGEWP